MSGRHPLHSICPYFAMFPEQFVAEQLLSYTSPGDLTLDPFCGRGTTVFQSLISGRRAIGADINPVAVCIASAKSNAPKFSILVERINALENAFRCAEFSTSVPPTPFFGACFESQTFTELSYLRSALSWQTDPVDCFLAAVLLGVLHGESHRTENCLSNRMPRTISTKPEYSIRWWSERRLDPPRRPVFDVVRKATAFRYRMPPAEIRGTVRMSDSRSVAGALADFAGQVKLVVTSPPYLDTTDYAEDQWLRLWFLGGEPFPQLRKHGDDRHRNIDAYWLFLKESWSGMQPLLADQATIVIRIGGAKLSKSNLFSGIFRTLSEALNTYAVSTIQRGRTSTIRPRETSAFRPSKETRNVEHDFVFRIEKVGL